MAEKKEKRNKLVLSKENILKLKSEQRELVYAKRKKVIEELKKARIQGDISDNAEYDAAKQKQVEIEERITKIEFLLKNSEAVQTRKENVVQIGKVVKLLDLKSDQEMSFKIGTFFDIDVEKNTISNNSPLVKSIIGSQTGQQVLIKGRSGQPSYWVKILKVSNYQT